MIFQNNTSLVQWGGNFPGTSCRHLSDLSSYVLEREESLLTARAGVENILLRAAAHVSFPPRKWSVDFSLIIISCARSSWREPLLWYSRAPRETKNREKYDFRGQIKVSVNWISVEKNSYSWLESLKGSFMSFCYILMVFIFFFFCIFNSFFFYCFIY